MTTDRVRGADLPSADAMPSLTRRRVRSALTTLVVPALLVLGVPLLFTSYRLTSLTTVATYLIVDTHARGFVYETGGVEREVGVHAARCAQEVYEMPIAILATDPADHVRWLADARRAALRTLET